MDTKRSLNYTASVDAVERDGKWYPKVMFKMNDQNLYGMIYGLMCATKDDALDVSKEISKRELKIIERSVKTELEKIREEWDKND